MRGYVVLFDRYYLFDYNRHLRVAGHERILFRLHRYLLERLYPRPDLVIFLDAPASVLFARKREGTVESLERRRQSFLKLGEELPNFVRVDATLPLSRVCREVLDHIERVASGLASGSRLTEERS
jgi:thymidylate kinase